MSERAVNHHHKNFLTEKRDEWLSHANLGVRVLPPSGVEGSREARQHHVGHQGVVDGEVGQPGAVWGPPVAHLRVQHLLWQKNSARTSDRIAMAAF